MLWTWFLEWTNLLLSSSGTYPWQVAHTRSQLAGCWEQSIFPCHSVGSVV